MIRETTNPSHHAEVGKRRSGVLVRKFRIDSGVEHNPLPSTERGRRRRRQKEEGGTKASSK